MPPHYNMLRQVVVDDSLTAWRFRVKIIRAHTYYVDARHGWCWSYIFADEEGTKIEMTIHSVYVERFREIENKEGNWVEIFGVQIARDYVGFKATKSGFRLQITPNTIIRTILPLNHHHYMEFVEIHKIPNLPVRSRKYPIDVMGVVFNFKAHFDDPANEKVEFYIRDNIEHEIRCVATGRQAYALRDRFKNMIGGGEVILVLKMWRIHRALSLNENDLWLQTEGGYSDFLVNPLFPEVVEFRHSILRTDPYVQRHGALPP